jgi:hypothetical protein
MGIKYKSAQEEMVGFAVIMVIIAVILLILISFLSRNEDKEVVESYEIESFIQTALQYTSDCENELEFFSLQGLIVACEEGKPCLDGKDSCLILNSTVEKLVENGWQTGEQSSIKGYNFKIITNDKTTLEFKKGNETRNYKSGFQGFAKSRDNYEVTLDIYT